MLLIDNARPRPMFLCFLLGRMGMALTVGLLDVFVLQADTISTRDSASAGIDLIVAAARRHCAAPAKKFASRLLGAHVTKTDALESLVIASFIRGLSIPAASPWCGPCWTGPPAAGAA